MKSARLYCQPSCAVCQSHAHQLRVCGIEVIVSDVTEDRAAFDPVVGLGYRALPVLVVSDGTSAAGDAAGDLAARLSRRTPKFVDANILAGTLNNRRDLA